MLLRKLSLIEVVSAGPSWGSCYLTHAVTFVQPTSCRYKRMTCTLQIRPHRNGFRQPDKMTTATI